MSNSYFGSIRPGDDELRKKRTSFGVRRGGGLGSRQGEYGTDHRQSTQEIRRHPMQIHG